MSEQKLPREHYVPIWGVFLLFLGIVFLLQSLNVLPWGLWGTLWRFWPVLIIIIGLGILLSRFNVWLVSLLILAILFACLGISIWQYGISPLPNQITYYSEALGSLEKAQVRIDFNAGTLKMSSLALNSPDLFEASSGEGKGPSGMKENFTMEGNTGILVLSKEAVGGAEPPWGADGNTWQMNLTRNVPLTLNIKSAASNTELDLTQLNIPELNLEVDAGNCKVYMPYLGITNASIKANVSNLEVTVPGVASRIKVNNALSGLDINESIFHKQGDYYVSGDFTIAKTQLYLDIDSNVGRVKISPGIPPDKAPVN